MLFTARVRLALLSDIDMLWFFERGICGGINGIGKLRYFGANNRDLHDFFESKANVHGASFDFTSLYAGTMHKLYLWTVMSGMKYLPWEKYLLPATIQ